MCMRKKVLSVALTAALAFSMTPSAAFAATDIEGHWGQAVLEEWEDYGVIRGYDDGTVRPDAAITRGEMATILDRIMGYQETAENEFSDLSEEDWCMDEMLRAVAAGAFHGDDVDEGEPATIRPNDTISREEAALVVSRVLDLDTENVPDSGFADDSAISDWAEPAVEAMAAAGYVNGYDDGTFRPQGKITRAEVVKIMDNVFADLYQAEGEYTGNVQGSAVIDSDGVVLKDTTISGDLIIAEGVADGHVELDNVTVEGRLIVRGGGENSVVIKGASKIGQIIVDRLGGAVRVAVGDAAEVASVIVDQAADGVRIEGKIGDLSVQGAASVVEVAGAVESIDVAESADEAKVTVLEGATVQDVKSEAKSATVVIAGAVVTVSVSGDSNEVTVSGTVSTVDVAGNDVVVKVEASATVEKVNTSATGTKVEGEGEVGSVVAGEGSSDVTVSTEDTKVENNGSGDVAIEGGAVAPGETDTTPGGSTSGGGGVVVPHVHNYVDGVCAADGAYDPSWAQVDSLEEWNAAVTSGQNIVIVNNFETVSQLRINHTVKVNGNGKTVTAAEGWSGSADNDAKHLLLVIDEAEVSTADNVTVKNLTLDSANKAYGAQSYCVDNTVFENVTLKNSVGAGLTVNGSSVEAKSLKTNGNTWGGVNVDKGDGVAEETSFTFDASSVFGESNETPERPAVYSNDGDVAVITPEGWVKTVVSNNNDDVCVWAKLFTAGNGMEQSPYVISDAAELAAMLNYAGYDDEHAKGKYFKVADGVKTIDLTAVLPEISEGLKAEYFDGYTGYATYISRFSGVFDGNGVTLSRFNLGDGYFALIGAVDSGEIKNLDVAFDSSRDSIICADLVNGALLENISVYADGVVQTGNNYSPFAYSAQDSTLRNCENHIDINGTYYAVFVAYTASNTCFENCINWGNLTGTYVGVLVGNQTSDLNNGLTISGCWNYGALYGTNKVGFVTGNPRNDSANDTFNQGYARYLTGSATIGDVVYTGSVFSPGVLAGFAMDAEGNITQCTDASKEVAYYQAVYTGYAVQSAGSGGTLFINVASDPIKHTGDGELATGFVSGCKIVDFDSASETIRDACVGQWAENKNDANNYERYAIVEVEGVTYCVIDFNSNTLSINATATLVARAYDAEGRLLGQVTAK